MDALKRSCKVSGNLLSQTTSKPAPKAVSYTKDQGSSDSAINLLSDLEDSRPDIDDDEELAELRNLPKSKA